MRSNPDLVCLSHLRWDFVYQRPQHLMSRFAAERRVFFVEEPIFDAQRPYMDVQPRQGGVQVAVPHLPARLAPKTVPSGNLDREAPDRGHPDRDDSDRDDSDAALAETVRMQRTLLTDLLERQEVRAPVLWYYTPMALPFTRHIRASGVVYDCMDELSAFAFAPPDLLDLERELFRRADLVFTGGLSLYEAKRRAHPSVHCFPSSVDVRHFRRARHPRPDPEDQALIPGPRLGFYGVIDERMDLDLIRGVADARPDWQFVLIGPVLKLDPECLPYRRNIHYLGPKEYRDLPRYLAGWDVAILPFARNESTRFISPTKTPEYLAAGRPVVSTSIRDVITPYGDMGLVRIADTVHEFVAAAQAAMGEDTSRRLTEIDDLLRDMSWDRTWARMSDLVESASAPREIAIAAREAAHV